MRRGRLFLLVALLLVIILAAVYFFSIGGFPSGTPSTGDVTGTEPTITPIPQTVEVVVITQKVTRGTDFTEAVLGLVEIPKDLQIPGSFTDISPVVGLRAKFDLDSGTILNENMTTESADQFSTTGSDSALLIPPGKVAVSIPISRLTSVAYGPQKGDHVNVIVSLLMVDLDTAYQTVLPNYTASVIAPGPQGPEGGPPVVLSAQIMGGGEASTQGRNEVDTSLSTDEETFFYYVVPSELQRPRMVSQTLIQDAIVLQVGTFELPEEAQAAPTPTPEPGVEEGGVVDGEASPVVTPEPVQLPDIITLIVSPQDAVTLNYLIYSGAKLSLALRPANDASLVQTEAVTMQYLLDVYGIPVPVKLPYGLEPRVDTLTEPELPNDNPTPTPVP
jgi:Flp pilus assembly protein CpaB